MLRADVLVTGWFLLLSSMAGFYRVKRWEKSIRAASAVGAAPAPAPGPPVDDSQNMTRAFPEMFLFRSGDENDQRREERHLSPAEERLARDLAAAGFL